MVGVKGETKKLIEKKTRCKINVTSDGEVVINGDSIDAYICVFVIRAIGRGFNPKIALKLIKEDYALVVISIPDLSGKPQKKDLFRIR